MESTLVKMFAIWCIVYTIVDLIYWVYYYFKKYHNQQGARSYDNNPKFKILTPDIFEVTVKHIFQNADKICGDDDFSNGRRIAYFEIFNIIKHDFIAYEVGFKRWNPNMFNHIITGIIKGADSAVNEANFNKSAYFNGRQAAYLETINTIITDFVRYNIDLEEYGLTRFTRR